MTEQVKKRIVLQDIKMHGFGLNKSTTEEPSNEVLKNIAEMIQQACLQYRITAQIVILGVPMEQSPDERISALKTVAKPQQQSRPSVPLRRPQPQKVQQQEEVDEGDEVDIDDEEFGIEE